MKKSTPIYVQNAIQTSMEKLWEYTQNPDIHTEWDARFTDIKYLDRKEDEPQRFLYKTNIGFGISIDGKGESVGKRHKETGERVSALKFWTDNPISLIREGRGYWKYTEKDHHIEFETQYDYDTNFGSFGRVIDRSIFRPLMGWATAWSFDALKLWLEKGWNPKLLLQKTLTYILVCLTLAVIWFYQGLVPKILTIHPQEVKMLTALSPAGIHGSTAIQIIGGLEVIFGILFLLPFQKRKLFIFHIIIMILLTIAAVSTAPGSAVHPFNPITLNIAMIFLSIIGFMNSRDLPMARNCKRTKRG